MTLMTVLMKSMPVDTTDWMMPNTLTTTACTVGP